MLNRNSIAAIALSAAALAGTCGGVQAFDETKYPAMEGILRYFEKAKN